MSHNDINSEIAGVLGDLAAIQVSKPKAFAYRHAAAVVMALEQPLDALLRSKGASFKIAGLGPSSMRVISEMISKGESPSAEGTIDTSGRGAEVEHLRAFRTNFLSRAEVIRTLANDRLKGPRLADYRGDLQMHSEWSDGKASIAEMARGCITRGYRFAAITDHSYGLPIAGGVTMAALERQHAEIEGLNAKFANAFRIIKGIEANIMADGSLDLAPDEVARLELVLAAPHAKLRLETDQTTRLLRTIGTSGVHVLAHPRGRKAGAREGIRADWDRVFRAAARANVAVEIDGDPSRQDLDHTMATAALDAGCLFALDSDAHSVAELRYADTAIAHARLAGIPKSRIINCWTLTDLQAWMRNRVPGARPRKRVR